MSMNGKRVTGIIKFFNNAKGFGFAVRDDGGGDVFIHANALKRSGIGETIDQGERVEFEVVPVEDRGPKAKNITRLSA